MQSHKLISLENQTNKPLREFRYFQDLTEGEQEFWALRKYLHKYFL